MVRLSGSGRLSAPWSHRTRSGRITVPAVLDDGAANNRIKGCPADVLTGSSGTDWFLFSSSGDKVTDLSVAEFDPVRDFINA